MVVNLPPTAPILGGGAKPSTMSKNTLDCLNMCNIAFENSLTVMVVVRGGDSYGIACI